MNLHHLPFIEPMGFSRYSGMTSGVNARPSALAPVPAFPFSISDAVREGASSSHPAAAAFRPPANISAHTHEGQRRCGLACRQLGTSGIALTALFIGIHTNFQHAFRCQRTEVRIREIGHTRANCPLGVTGEANSGQVVAQCAPPISACQCLLVR